jgi:CBS domain-containing protein
MQIAALMTTTVHTCSPSSTLADVVRIMRDADCGIVPVVDAAFHVLGVITDRDVSLALCDGDRRPSQIEAASIMSRPGVTVSPRDALATAERLMQDRQIRRVLVTTDGQLVGILSLGDLARRTRSTKARESQELAPNQIAETLAAVSEARAASAQLTHAQEQHPAP